MKVAIFFSGRVKGFEAVKDHLEKFKREYSADFYVSCGSHEESFHNFIKEFSIEESRCKFEEVKIPKEFKTLRKATETKLENCSSMFFHNKNCIELIKGSGIPYDIVVKYRADINSDKILDLRSSKTNLKRLNFNYPIYPIVQENTVYIPKGNDFGGLNDQIAYGDLCAMEKYCAVFSNIVKICNDGHRFHPETLVMRNLERERVNVARFDYTWSLIPNRR
jgi:hypothetical protein